MRVAELKKEVFELKAQLDNTEIEDDDSNFKDEDSDVHMDKDNGVQVDVQSVSDFIDGLSLMA